MCLGLSFVYICCLVSVLIPASSHSKTNDLKTDPCMDSCLMGTHCEPKQVECITQCLKDCVLENAQNVARRKQRDIFTIPKMPQFPEFEGAKPFKDQSIGEQLFNQSNEKNSITTYNVNNMHEQFIPDPRAEIFHPACIEKFAQLYPNENITSCEPEECNVTSARRKEMLECSKDFVALKGYVRDYSHSDDKTIGNENNESSGFKNVLTKSGVETKVFNSSTGGNVYKNANDTTHYAKDLVLNEAGKLQIDNTEDEKQTETQREDQPEHEGEDQPENEGEDQPEHQPEQQREDQPEQQPEHQPEHLPEQQREGQPEHQREDHPEQQPEHQPEHQPKQQPEHQPGPPATDTYSSTRSTNKLSMSRSTTKKFIKTKKRN